MLPILAALVPLLDKFIPDKKQAAEVKLQMFQASQAGELKELDAAMKTITAEARSENKVTASWRPITMLVFAAIIANNYLFAPYLGLMFGVDSTVFSELPPEMWDLLKIGVGGYIGGRSLEKAVKYYKGTK